MFLASASMSEVYPRGEEMCMIPFHNSIINIQDTNVDFSAGVHDVICTRKINIDRGSSHAHIWKKKLLNSSSSEPEVQ